MLLFACVICLQEKTCAVARKGVAMARRTLRDGNVDSNQSNQEGADAGAEAITQREQDTSTGTNETKK